MAEGGTSGVKARSCGRRVRKTVDYSKFADSDDSDDDFWTATPPVPKKPRLEKPEKATKPKVKKEKLEKETAKTKVKKSLNRRPPGEDLFDEELKTALELSLVETSSQEPESEKSQENNVVELPDDDDTTDEFKPVRIVKEKSTKTALKVSSSCEPKVSNSAASKPDVILLDSPEKSRSPPKPAKIAKEKPSKTSISVQSNLKTANAKSYQVPKPANVSSDKPTSKIATPKPGLGIGVSRKPAWTPPAPTGSSGKSVNLGSISIKSPSGGLRLGLSRSQHVKPLHSSVKGAR